MKTKLLKTIAIFLALTLLADVIAPTALMAIGSGPSAPEYSSFMQAGKGISVSPQSGDMSYNLPLINLPCPEGDYPINLFYNAGIQPEQDASWLGLGFNLNVGSISRNVKGIPDDYNDNAYTVTDESKGHANVQEILEGATTAGVFTKNDFNSPYFVNFDVGIPSNPSLTQASKTQTYSQYGIVQAKDASTANNMNSNNIYSYVMFDTYPLYDNYENIVTTKPNPEKFNGGTLPSYDEYIVSGQGISGIMEPLVLENGSLFRQPKGDPYGSNNMRNPNVNVGYSILRNFTQNKQQFRFKGEFSNSLMATPSNYYLTNNNTDATINFSGTNGNGYDYSVPSNNAFNSINPTTLRFAGAHHVEYYLNHEIMAGTAKANGFINYQGANNLERDVFTYRNPLNNFTYFPVNKRIGGFSVTNPDGTTYHYALPVYTYNQKNSYSYNLPNSTTRNINRQIDKPDPYAYTWLLTTVTGADYYDANNNGYADYGDWGRWTNFVYNKSTHRYFYRDPLVGDRVDENDVKSNTSGIKELYYLEAAYSRTHSLLFVKDGRTDAPSQINFGFENPVKLASIVLLKNEAITKINTALGGTNTDFFGCFNNIKKAVGVSSSVPYTNNNIIDVLDIQTIAGLSTASYKSSIINEIKFNYDYSLCPVVENQPLANLSSTGKLTLKSIKFIGQNNSSPLAPIEFSYELDNQISTNVYITHIPGQLNEGAHLGRIDIGNAGSNLKEGDIIKIVFNDSKTYFATLIRGIAYNSPVINLYDVVFLGNNIPGTDKIWTSTPAIATTTKNPPYTKEFFDNWGNFKSDYSGFPNTAKKDRTTTLISSKSVDAWSLRRILNSSGSVEKIDYESDVYASSSYNNISFLNLKPEFEYTKSNGILSSLASYCDFRNITKNGNFYFKIREDITNKLAIGMRVQIATIATFSRITESATDYQTSSEQKKTYYGVDDFDITYIDLANNAIIGTFINTSGMANTNPFWCTPNGSYPDKKMFYHNMSCLYYNKNSIPNTKEYGGGIRVSKLTTKENSISGKELIIEYNYNDAISGGASGSVIYNPIEAPSINNNNNKEVPVSYNSWTPVYTSENPSIYQPAEYDNYNTKYYNINKNALNINKLTNTGVIYEYVTIKRKVDANYLPIYEQMRFQKPTADVISITKTNDIATTNNTRYCTINIVDNTAKIGRLLSRKLFDLSNSVIEEKRYSYNSSINDIINFQGVLEQVFHEKRLSDNGSGVGAVTKLSRYPSVLMNTTITNYLKSTSESIANLGFDLFSGSTTKVENRDSYGNQFITENIAAYNTYPEMGLKHLGVNYKNMLSAKGTEIQYKYNAGFNPVPKYTGSSVMLWAKNNTTIKTQLTNNPILEDQIVNNNVWRPSDVYELNMNNLNIDGTANAISFDYSTPSNNSTSWIKTIQPQKYTPYSNLYLSSDANDVPKSIRYGYNGTKPIAICDLSNNYEYTYCGAEDPNTSAIQPNTSMYLDSETGYFGGDVFGVPNKDATYAHTGKYSVKLNQSGGTGFVYRSYIKPGYLNVNRSYKTSVWVYSNAAVNNVSLTYKAFEINASGVASPTSTTNSAWVLPTSVTCGNWKLVEMVFTIPVLVGNYYMEFYCTNNNTTTAAWVDDFRLQPIESSMNSYVYDELTDKLLYTLDKDNFYTRYEYDSFGRQIATYKETINGEKKINDAYYNYSRK